MTGQFGFAFAFIQLGSTKDEIHFESLVYSIWLIFPDGQTRQIGPSSYLAVFGYRSANAVLKGNTNVLSEHVLYMHAKNC